MNDVCNINDPPVEGGCCAIKNSSGETIEGKWKLSGYSTINGERKDNFSCVSSTTTTTKETSKSGSSILTWIIALIIIFGIIYMIYALINKLRNIKDKQ